MSFLFIIRASTCMYLISLLTTPMEIVDMTAVFLSLMVPTDRNNILSHTVQCVCLVASFVILYTISGLNALKRIIVPKPEVSSSSSFSSSSKTAIRTTKKQISNKNNAPVITPMRSTADLPTSHNNNNKQAEPIAVSNSNNRSKRIGTATTPSHADAPLGDLSPSNEVKKEQLAQLINNDTIIKKEDPTDTQVIPRIVNEEYVDVLVKEVVAQPTILVKTPELSIPLEQNNRNDSSASTEIADDDRSSKKDHYYEEINKKGNNIMAFSDNLQRIFNEPPTPSLDHNVRPFSAIHTSTVLIDEAITTTPALTPPNQSSAAGSTLSRKSSTTSQHSTLFKSRLQMAMQKVARSSSINNNNNNNKQQQDVIDTATTSSLAAAAAATAKSATSVEAKAAAPVEASATKKKRFSSIRLTRKKSLISPAIVDNSQQESSTAAPAPVPTIRPKKSISTKFLKNTGKRISKIFS